MDLKRPARRGFFFRVAGQLSGAGGSSGRLRAGQHDQGFAKDALAGVEASAKERAEQARLLAAQGAELQSLRSERQRTSDLEAIQLRMASMEQNTTALKEETEQILTSIISNNTTAPGNTGTKSY